MLAMSGPDVARELIAIRPGWPVIISSGYETDELLASGSGRSLTNQVQPSAWPWRSQKSLRCELRLPVSAGVDQTAGSACGYCPLRRALGERHATARSKAVILTITPITTIRANQ
jgi:hypothetical protein